MDLMGTCVVVVARFVLLVGCHAVPDQAQYQWVLAAVRPIDGSGLRRTEPSERGIEPVTPARSARHRWVLAGVGPVD